MGAYLEGSRDEVEPFDAEASPALEQICNLRTDGIEERKNIMG